MTIFHGSNVIVERPEILQSERMLDFGVGFYTTSNRSQAVRWAQRVASRREPKDQLISKYEFDLEAAERRLLILRFGAPDGNWLDFVCANRMGSEISQPYDIVLGPVADDKVYAVVQLYENGVYSKEEAIKRLKTEDLFDQILFHTEKSLEHCHYSGFEKFGGA